jgi:hypothetical protein
VLPLEHLDRIGPAGAQAHHAGHCSDRARNNTSQECC